MEKLYTLGIVVICFIIMRKIFTLFNKRIETTEEYKEQNRHAKKNEFSDEHQYNTDFVINENIVFDENNVKPIITTKNTFLYPDDDFGTMKNGKVYNSITYESGIIDKNSSVDKMKIITIKKKNKSSK